jgi:hypothetical protein
MVFWGCQTIGVPMPSFGRLNMKYTPLTSATTEKAFTSQEFNYDLMAADIITYMDERNIHKLLYLVTLWEVKQP